MTSDKAKVLHALLDTTQIMQHFAQIIACRQMVRGEFNAVLQAMLGDGAVALRKLGIAESVPCLCLFRVQFEHLAIRVYSHAG